MCDFCQGNRNKRKGKGYVTETKNKTSLVVRKLDCDARSFKELWALGLRNLGASAHKRMALCDSEAGWCLGS